MKLGWRFGLIVLIVGVALYYLYPIDKSVTLGLDLKGGMYLTLEVDLAKLHQLKPDANDEDAVNRALEIIRSRVDQFGVAEPLIVREGRDRIIVQLPGVRDVDVDLSFAPTWDPRSMASEEAKDQLGIF